MLNSCFHYFTNAAFKPTVQNYYIKINVCYIQALNKRVHSMLILPITGKYLCTSPYTVFKSGVVFDIPALAG